MIPNLLNFLLKSVKNTIHSVTNNFNDNSYDDQPSSDNDNINFLERYTLSIFHRYMNNNTVKLNGILDYCGYDIIDESTIKIFYAYTIPFTTVFINTHFLHNI